MKIIVTHLSPDLDAIGSVWIIKKFLSGWHDALVEFVPAGLKSKRVYKNPDFETFAIVQTGNDEIIHVDTGLGPLDHHQTADMNTSGIKLAWEFVKTQHQLDNQTLREELQYAVSRIVEIIVNYDHFQEVYWPDPSADYYDLSLFGINEGYQYSKQNDDAGYVEFGSKCLDYLLHYFENKVWAEKELEKGTEFKTKYGKALGIETINESVIKVAQKKGFVLVARKDTRKGFVSIKTLPEHRHAELVSAPIKSGSASVNKREIPKPIRQAQGRRVRDDRERGIDLTLAYEQLSKMDPEATWYLHVSKKMLLNGTVKNPDMKPTKLSLGDIIKVLEKLYK